MSISLIIKSLAVLIFSSLTVFGMESGEQEGGACWTLNQKIDLRHKIKKSGEAKDIEAYQKFAKLLTEPPNQKPDCIEDYFSLIITYTNYCPLTPIPARPQHKDIVMADRLILKAFKATENPPLEKGLILAYWLSPYPLGAEKDWEVERQQTTNIWLHLLKRLDEPKGPDAEISDEKLQYLRQKYLNSARVYFHYAYKAKPAPNPDKLRKQLPKSGLSSRLIKSIEQALDAPLGSIKP